MAAAIGLLAPAVADELVATGAAVEEGLARVESWLVDGPLNPSDDDIDRYVDLAVERLRHNGSAVAALPLVSGGLVDALLVAGLVVVVQQVEGDVLAPLVIGRALRLHSVVIVVVLTTGTVVARRLGAFLAVPVTPVAAAMVNELRCQPERHAAMASGGEGRRGRKAP